MSATAAVCLCLEVKKTCKKRRNVKYKPQNKTRFCIFKRGVRTATTTSTTLGGRGCWLLSGRKPLHFLGLGPNCDCMHNYIVIDVCRNLAFYLNENTRLFT